MVPAPAPVAKASLAPAALPVSGATPAAAPGAYVQIPALAYGNPIGYQILTSGPYVTGSSIAFTVAKPLLLSTYPSTFDVTFTGLMHAVYHDCRVAAVSQQKLPALACANIQTTAPGTGATGSPNGTAPAAAAPAGAPSTGPPAKITAKPAATP